eukprot:3929295-Pleurochrysis_carterae.AAC.2
MQREPHSRWAQGRDLQAELVQKIARAEWYARRPRPISVPLRHPRSDLPNARPQLSASAPSSALALNQKTRVRSYALPAFLGPVC